MTDTKHIKLLSETEIADLYDRPEFNEEERALYFTITEKRELDALNHYSNIKTRVYFILQLGYFKAKHQFFYFEFEDVRSDVEYILSNFTDSTETVLSGRISRNYITQQKSDILGLLAYQEWSPKIRPQIESHVCELLKLYPKLR